MFVLFCQAVAAVVARLFTPLCQSSALSLSDATAVQRQFCFALLFDCLIVCFDFHMQNHRHALCLFGIFVLFCFVLFGYASLEICFLFRPRLTGRRKVPPFITLSSPAAAVTSDVLPAPLAGL